MCYQPKPSQIYLTSLLSFSVLGHQVVQRRQGKDVWGVIAVSTEPNQTKPRIQSHVERDQGDLSQRNFRGRKFPDHKKRRRRVLEDVVRWQVRKINLKLVHKCLIKIYQVQVTHCKSKLKLEDCWRPACCWLKWGSTSIGDLSKSHLGGSGGLKNIKPKIFCLGIPSVGNTDIRKNYQ